MGVGERREGRVEEEGRHGMGRRTLREQNDQDGGRTETESKERDILIEGVIMGLGRNLALEKFPGIHGMTPVKTLSNSGEGA